MAEQTILTEEGLKKLEDELDYLRSEKRQQVAERLKVAISYGDISENSEYDDAKNEQAFVEGRILTLENMIRNAQIIKDTDITKNVVSLGCKVKIEDMETHDQEEYTAPDLQRIPGGQSHPGPESGRCGEGHHPHRRTGLQDRGGKPSRQQEESRRQGRQIISNTERAGGISCPTKRRTNRT